MSQALTARDFVNASSRAKRTARTLLLRVAADEARAERIRTLKQEHPEHTWQAIADYVGVSLRAAQAWQEAGGISYPNAKKLAQLWQEDVLYIMQGERGTPDLSLIQGADDGAKLDRILAELQGLREERLSLRAQIEEQNGLLSDLRAEMDALQAMQALLPEFLRAQVAEARRERRDSGT